MIAVRDSGLVYRNPRPELRSHHAWHPSLTRFDDGELVCVFDGASADQALDYRSFVTRSTDSGATWTWMQHPLLTDAARQLFAGRLPLWTTGRLLWPFSRSEILTDVVMM
jgi:hypothetical protein